MLEALYDCVQKRPRPEDVAELVLEALESQSIVDPRERIVLNKAATFSLKRRKHAYSSMAADFVRPSSGLAKNVASAAMLLGTEPLDAADCMDPGRVEAFVRTVSSRIAKTYGESERCHKLTKAQRRALGMFKNARWYNRRWRLLCRMEKKILSLTFNLRKYLFTRVGKSGLAVQIPYDDFAADLDTACLVAYLSSRMSSRSVFTNESQARAFDEIAEVLLRRCEVSSTARWDVIAHIMPDAKVLARLADHERGRLLGRWWGLLRDMASMLEGVYTTQSFDRSTMIVARGDDSSTWNQVAGGWNQARAQWISLLYAMGLDSILDIACPGKVMRLMAADVARWHQASGNDIHPDTRVWAALPPPWEVIDGKTKCTRAMVEAACHDASVDPKSWIDARGDRKGVEFKPTPELVHGVEVASPSLALLLRRAGVFSGKSVSGFLPEFNVERDEHGAALRATDAGVTERVIAK